MKINMKNVMKNKKIYICGVIVIGLLLFIIVKGGNKTVHCSMKSDQSKNGYVLETEYVIKAKRSNVKKVFIKETIKSKDEKTIDKFEKNFKEQYEYNKKNYGGFTYKVKKNKDVLKTDVVIDYDKFDMKKFVENNAAMKTYTKDNKLTLDGAKKLYESTGAKCK